MKKPFAKAKGWRVRREEIQSTAFTTCAKSVYATANEPDAIRTATLLHPDQADRQFFHGCSLQHREGGKSFFRLPAVPRRRVPDAPVSHCRKRSWFPRKRCCSASGYQ